MPTARFAHSPRATARSRLMVIAARKDVPLVLPHTGIGPVRLGMTRAEVHGVAGPPSSRRGGAKEFFAGLSVMKVEHDANTERVAFIEVSPTDAFEVRYTSARGASIFGAPAEKVVARLA